LAEPVAESLGYFIWDVEYVKEGARQILRITIDTEADEGITIEDCEKMHRAIDPVLDEADPIESAYYLEVSSPGIERELKYDFHFLACEDWDVEVKLYAPDEKGRKKFRARIATPYVKSLRRKINRRGYGDLGAEIETILDELDKLEASRPPSVDQPAALFGKAMAHLLSFDLEGSRARIARELGTHLGRWIYLVDAIDDFESDLKAGRYNPFACLWQDGDMTPSRREYLENVLAAELEAMENALDLAESSEGDKDLWGVIRNILYLGMPARAHSILFPNDGAVEEKSK
jgi:ribosome maturation factor RimP